MREALERVSVQPTKILYLSKMRSRHPETETAVIRKNKGKIQIKQDNQGVFFTVPYDEGWKIKVDNKEIQGKVAFDTFVYVPLNEGEYEIELVFEPRGLKLGTIISIFSTLCLLVLWKLRKI